MKKQLLLIATLFFAALTNAQNFEWAKKIGVSSDPENTSCVASDASDNLYSVGTFRNTVDFDPNAGVFNLTNVGWVDAFVQKLDASGNFVWAKSFGGADTDAANGVQVDSNGDVIVVGRFRGTVDFDPGPGASNQTSTGVESAFVLKLNSSGDFVWVRTFGTDYATAYVLDVDENNGIYVSGTFNDTVDFDPGPSTFLMNSLTTNSDVFVLKLDANGDFVWAESLEGTSSESATEIRLDNTGNILLSGNYTGTIDFDPGPGTSSNSSSGYAAYIVKLDNSGTYMWDYSIENFSSLHDVYSEDVTFDDSNNVFFVGSYESTVDFDPTVAVANETAWVNRDGFVVKLDSIGTYLWHRLLSGTGDEFCSQIEIGDDQNLLISGYFTDLTDIDPGPTYTTVNPSSTQLYFWRLGNDGEFNSMIHTGGQAPGVRIINSMILTDQSSIYSGGYIRNSTDFDPGSGTFNLSSYSMSNNDAFMWKLSMCSSPQQGIDAVSACDSYTWIDSVTYTSSNNTATYTYYNGGAGGCDSTVVLDLTITNSSSGTDTQVACDSYAWIDGNTYTSSTNSPTWVLTNAAGCDSTVTLDLTINSSASGTDVQSACDSYTWIDGNTYTSNNNSATHTITGGAANGCDSTVTLNLTVTTLNTNVTESGATLTSSATGVSYQWVDCDNNNAPIAGATSQSFTATVTGNYAVIIDDGTCSDMSACYLVDLSSLSELEKLGMQVYPNPTSKGIFNVDYVGSVEKVEVVDVLGRLVMAAESKTVDVSKLSTGEYTVRIWVDHQRKVNKRIAIIN